MPCAMASKREFGAVPAVVAVHRVVAAGDRRDAADGQARPGSAEADAR